MDYRATRLAQPATSQHDSPITQYVYNEAGQVKEIHAPSPTTGVTRVARFECNFLGQQIATIAPDPVTGYDGPTTTSCYDAAGNLVSQTDPLGNTTHNVFDALGRLSVNDGRRPR